MMERGFHLCQGGEKATDHSKKDGRQRGGGGGGGEGTETRDRKQVTPG